MKENEILFISHGISSSSHRQFTITNNRASEAEPHEGVTTSSRPASGSRLKESAAPTRGERKRQRRQQLRAQHQPHDHHESTSDGNKLQPGEKIKRA